MYFGRASHDKAPILMVAVWIADPAIKDEVSDEYGKRVERRYDVVGADRRTDVVISFQNIANC